MHAFEPDQEISGSDLFIDIIRGKREITEAVYVLCKKADNEENI